MILVVLGAGGLLVGLGSLLRHRSQPQPPAGSVSAHAPSAIKPAAQAVAAYTVAPDVPKYIEIPGIGVKKSRVVGIGLKNGQISSPDNIYDAGWYHASSKPDQSGAMFIFGHVSSWQANGIFYNLKKMKVGNQVTITRGDNKTFNYKVEKIKTYDANNVDMNEVLSPVAAGKNGLNIMTCSGTVIKGTSNFTNRLVIFTSQLPAM